MKRTGRAARRARRAAVRVAALSGMLAVSGLAAGAASASGNQGSTPSAAALALTYQCRFPAGAHPVAVGITAHLPALAKVGKPIQPAGVTLTMLLLGLVAAWIPARRALAVDPMILLREE